jgi:hypothetical protein
MKSLSMSALAILGLVLTSSTLASQDGRPIVHLLKAQDYYGRRLVQAHDSVWYGIYRADDKRLLLPSRLRVDTTATPLGCTPEATRVRVDQPGEPLFLIHGLPRLSGGPIEVAFDGTAFISPGEPRELRLGEHQIYRLSARGTRRGRPGDITFAHYELQLEYGDRKQVLASSDLVEDAGPALIFAADLDRDQRLDLILDLRQSYVGHHYALFVSSLAERDSLVLKVAELPIAGC